MSNLKEIKEFAEQKIRNDRDDLPILAEEHLYCLSEILERTGRYTGLVFKSIGEKDGGLNDGEFCWNNNSMTNTSEFVVSMSLTTEDANNISKVLEFLSAGSLLKFKDFIGRSAFLEYQSHVINSGYADITVKGFSDNYNYSYVSTDLETCIIEFYKSKSGLTILNEEGESQGETSELKIGLGLEYETTENILNVGGDIKEETINFTNFDEDNLGGRTSIKAGEINIAKSEEGTIEIDASTGIKVSGDDDNFSNVKKDSVSVNNLDEKTEIMQDGLEITSNSNSVKIELLEKNPIDADEYTQNLQSKNGTIALLEDLNTNNSTLLGSGDVFIGWNQILINARSQAEVVLVFQGFANTTAYSIKFSYATNVSDTILDLKVIGLDLYLEEARYVITGGGQRSIRVKSKGDFTCSVFLIPSLGDFVNQTPELSILHESNYNGQNAIDTLFDQKSFTNKTTLVDDSEFLNGWGNYNPQNLDPAPFPVGYTKRNGIVYLRGRITGGTSGNAMFLLPSDMQPSEVKVLSVINSDSTDVTALFINELGSLFTYSVPSSGWLSLDGVSFILD